jgi:thiol-disulfide isomerase/thioredoxin
MKQFLWLSICLLLVGCTAVESAGNFNTQPELVPPTVVPVEADLSHLQNFGDAPELSTDVWLNTDQVLRLADLRGKVVLIEMWTFGCINCKNVIPFIKNWHENYADQGLVVIGNHYPEFGYEKELDNLKQAVADLDIPYAVTQDNEGKNWRAYETRYWPTLFLIDKHGQIRYQHIGEGNYDQTEQVIQELLQQSY